MPQLIKNRAVADDRWTLLREAASLADVPAGTPVIVPLALWKAERSALVARGDAGVWLTPSDEPAELASDISALTLIAVDFQKFTDGRAYSTARVLGDRTTSGELRAIGDVLRDQLFALAHAVSMRSLYGRPQCDRSAGLVRRFSPRLRADDLDTPALVPTAHRGACEAGDCGRPRAQDCGHGGCLAGNRRPPCPRRVRVELRRRGHGRDRSDREASAADSRFYARYRPAARRDACADRPHAQALRPAGRRVRARHAAREGFVRAHGVNASTTASNSARTTVRSQRRSRAPAHWWPKAH